MSDAHLENGSVTSAPRRSTQAPEEGWLLLIYRVPPDPSNNRVTVWRNLKRMGGLYLQQCVCMLPAFPECLPDIETAIEKITAYGGSYNKFRVRDLEPKAEAELLESFRELSRKEYAEILEECRAKFAKEIAFERFRENYTYEEAEEIREDLNKIRRWHKRVVERDWFDAGMRAEVEGELELCDRMLQAFEADVYARLSQDQGGERPSAQSGAGAAGQAAIGGDENANGDLEEASLGGVPSGQSTRGRSAAASSRQASGSTKRRKPIPGR
jgi:hypothetical protein